jgi:serpin B
MGCMPSPAPPSDAQANLFAHSTNAFAFDLWARVREQSGNQVVAPASIAMALAMTFGGARGETAAQMKRVLHVSDAAALHEAAGHVLGTWNDPSRESYTLAVASRLFGERTFTLEPSFLELTREHYRAPLEALELAGAPEDARAHINGWVARHTRNRIRDVIPAGAIGADTRLVLTNAVYLAARWLTPFHPLSAEVDFFAGGTRRVWVPTMRRVVPARYADVERVQVLDLPYAGNELAMTIVLPRERNGLRSVESQLDASRLATWVGALESRHVDTTLPKFRVAPEPSLRLRETLAAMGMPHAFSREEADLTGIANPPCPDDRLWLSEVFHKAFVQVDEDGTESAAASGGISRAGMPAEPPVTFRANHPFLFLIRDVRSGAILFLGRLTNPAT